MAEQREVLKNEYKMFSESAGKNDKNKDLEDNCSFFLENHDKDTCFKFLPFDDAKRYVQVKAGDDYVHHLEYAMESLEKYTLNLIKKPWCKDFHTIKTYNGFFKYNIEQWISACVAFKILELAGYNQQERTGTFKQAGNIDKERVLVVSFELYLARLVTKLFRLDRNSVGHLMDNKVTSALRSSKISVAHSKEHYHKSLTLAANYPYPSKDFESTLKGKTFEASTLFDKDGQTVQPTYKTTSDNLVSLKNISDDQLYESELLPEKYLGSHNLDSHSDDQSHRLGMPYGSHSDDQLYGHGGLPGEYLIAKQKLNQNLDGHSSLPVTQNPMQSGCNFPPSTTNITGVTSKQEGKYRHRSGSDVEKHSRNVFLYSERNREDLSNIGEQGPSYQTGEESQYQVIDEILKRRLQNPSGQERQQDPSFSQSCHVCSETAIVICEHCNILVCKGCQEVYRVKQCEMKQRYAPGKDKSHTFKVIDRKIHDSLEKYSLD